MYVNFKSDPLLHTVGDKVTIRSSSKRGVVEKVLKRTVAILLEDGEKLSVEYSEVRNYSLDARKAWQTNSDRNMGRPKKLKKVDRVQVNFRVDTALWQRFKELEDGGYTPPRSKLAEKMLKDAVVKAKQMVDKQRKSQD